MASPAVQSIIVALLVGAALLFVGARLYRTFAAARRQKDGCGGDCCGK